MMRERESDRFNIGLTFSSNVVLKTSEIDISVSKLLGFETFAKSLRVSVSENLVSEKKSRFRFRKNLVSEKSFGFSFGKFGFGKKSLGFGFEQNLVSEKSLGLGFEKFGLGNEKIKITRTVLVMMSQIWDLVPIGTKALKWSHISPNSACKSQISSLWQDAKSNISLINSTVNNNKKHVIFNLIVFVIVCLLSQRKCPYLNAFAECLLLNNVI